MSIQFKPWPGKMTGRERFLNQMNGGAFDRSFNMEFGYWDENFTEWKIFAENGIKNNAEADAFFAFDKIASVGSEVWMHPCFDSEVVEHHQDYDVIINSDGVICEVQNTGHASIPHFLKSVITTPDDWKKVKEERFRLDDPARIPDIEALKTRHPAGRDYPLGIWCGSMIGKIRDMLTFEGLAYAAYDYPEMVEDMVETCCQLVEQSLDMLLPHFQFDYASGWEDICFRSGPLVTVEFFRDVVMPRYKRIRRKLDQYGIKLWYIDCDGDVRPILPYFIEGGVNCLFPYEVNSCAHPGEILDAYDGQMKIMGGVDKIRLASGREEIRKYLDSLVPYVERGGYIPFCDHRCPPNVPEDDYLFYLDLKKRMFGLKD